MVAASRIKYQTTSIHGSRIRQKSIRIACVHEIRKYGYRISWRWIKNSSNDIRLSEITSVAVDETQSRNARSGTQHGGSHIRNVRNHSTRRMGDSVNAFQYRTYFITTD